MQTQNYFSEREVSLLAMQVESNSSELISNGLHYYCSHCGVSGMILILESAAFGLVSAGLMAL
jgi:hypothetical protein